MDEASDRSDRLTIGEMARRTRLTVKALRWYDEVGVLPPDHVDPVTGYRFYRPEQVTKARLVGLLRELDMPLAEVAQFLTDPSPARLRAWWQEQETVLRRRAGLVAYLQVKLSEGAPPMFDVRTREVAAEQVATVSAQVLQSELNSFIPATSTRLRKLIAAQGGHEVGRELVLYHSMITPDVEGTVEVCVPFTGTIEPADDVTVRVEPARTEAFARVTKGQVLNLEIMHAFDAVAWWLREHGHEMAGAPREVYFGPWDTAKESDEVVDVAFPFVP